MYNDKKEVSLMKCKKCGTEVASNTAFCPECGEKIVKTTKKTEKVEENNQNVEAVNISNNKEMEKLKEIVTNPLKTIEKNVKNIKTPKKLCIFTIALAGVMTILNFFRVLFANVWVKQWSMQQMQYITKFDLSVIRRLNYGNLIFKQFFMYVVLLLMIAFVFYIVTLALKKDADYFDFLAVTLLAVIPNILFSHLITPILELFHANLGVISNTIGTLFTIFIFYEVLNTKISFKEKDKKMYFYVICFAIIYTLNFVIVSQF